MNRCDFAQLCKALLDGILVGEGATTHAQRRSAFENTDLAEPLKTLVDKVVHRSYAITDDDVRAVNQSGMSEDAIFELVVCGAVGEASRQYEMALRALEGAEGP
jgi:hypothetical protein